MTTIGEYFQREYGGKPLIRIDGTEYPTQFVYEYAGYSHDGNHILLKHPGESKPCCVTLIGDFMRMEVHNPADHEQRARIDAAIERLKKARKRQRLLRSILV